MIVMDRFTSLPRVVQVVKLMTKAWHDRRFRTSGMKCRSTGRTRQPVDVSEVWLAG